MISSLTYDEPVWTVFHLLILVLATYFGVAIELRPLMKTFFLVLYQPALAINICSGKTM